MSYGPYAVAGPEKGSFWRNPVAAGTERRIQTGIERRLADALSEVSELRHRLDAIERSPFWRVTAVIRAVLARTPRLRHALRRVARGIYRVVRPPFDLLVRLLQGKADRAYTRWILENDTLSDVDRMRIAQAVESMPEKPLISILMPVFDTPEHYLREAIESVRSQLYPHWQLCIADDASTEPHVAKVLADYAADGRIRVHHRGQNGNISRASNDALSLATGSFVALMDHDDLIPPHALFVLASEILSHPAADVIYSDEDRIDDEGRRSDPYFKPDWNPELMAGHNVISHLGAYRRSLLERLGGFREGFEGSQDYDLALRAADATEDRRIRHIPAVLYHWRRHANGASFSDRRLDQCIVTARRAIADHFERRGEAVEVVAHPRLATWHRAVHALPSSPPLVSAIIPTRDRPDLLEACVLGLLLGTEYRDLEILIVDNGSELQSTRKLLNRLSEDKRVRVLSDPRPFNFSALNNLAAGEAHGEVLLLLNDDIRIKHPDWLMEMIRHAIRPEVGAVGAKLLYPNGRVQHGGIAVGVGGIANHFHHLLCENDPGYFGRAELTQRVSAVTAACLAVRRSVYLEAGGLDEVHLPVAFNDVDFCLRLGEAGLRNIWTPHARLEHLESPSRGADITFEKAQRFGRETAYMRQRWGSALAQDPFYNPNFSRENARFGLANRSRYNRPWSVSSGNLDQAAATTAPPVEQSERHGMRS